jgi:hypothetical protein
MNAIRVAESLRESFVRYLTTTFVGHNPQERRLAEELRRHFEKRGVLFRGPYLELNPPYATGRTLRDLAQDGIVTDRLLTLAPDALPPDRLLYRHQEQAITHVLRNRRNLVVATGTGSGKTECFLVPVLHDLLTDSTPGVRALFIYPMNALVNDQLRRLREILRGSSITFGRYTSELENRETVGRQKSPDAPPNEIVSREVLRGTGGNPPRPPQILITNYAMLEYLLLRPEDSVIFESGAWRFVVLDEAHTYTGAQGIEVSMLLRRLKHRLNKQRGELRCIATSATLTRDDPESAASFAASLFGEDFEEGDVLTGELALLEALAETAEPALPLSAYLYPAIAPLLERLRAAVTGEGTTDPTLLSELADALGAAGLTTAERAREATHGAQGDVSRLLWSVLRSNPHLSQLRQQMRERPVNLETASEVLFGQDSDPQQASDAVCRLVELGGMARSEPASTPLLPARYHLFARAPQGVWVCLNPHCNQRVDSATGWSRIFAEQKRERCDCGARVYDLTVCRHCGQPFVRGFERDGHLAQEGRYPDDTTGQRYFTWLPIAPAPDPDAAEETDEEEVGVPQVAWTVCLSCQAIGSTCRCDRRLPVSLHCVLDNRGTPRESLFTCPRCAARATQVEIVSSVRVRGLAPLAVLMEELYRQSPPSPNPEVQRKPGGGRKLLTFSDSRQIAARYAAFLQATTDETLHRHLIARAAFNLSERGEPFGLRGLADECFALAQSYGLYPSQLTPDDRRARMNQVRGAIMREFCARVDPRHSLWAIGLIGCDVHFFEQPPLPPALLERLGLDANAARVAVQALLDTMRLDKAVTMPEGVRHNDAAVFGLNTGLISYRLTGADTRAGERNWAGASNNAPQRLDSNSRFNYVRRILEATERPAAPTDVQNRLGEIWQWLQQQGVLKLLDGARFQLDVERLVFDARGRWYRCNRCLRLTRRLLSPDLPLCPSRGCNGALRECDVGMELSDNHYRRLFTREPIHLRVEEHTAQLGAELGREYQEDFVNGNINALSCSTTFELGVDVGDLQTVVLNNVPPTVSNYRQRAGRAGRRAGGAAFILTFARDLPHDIAFFSRPEDIIAGEVSVPRLVPHNNIIARRHTNALMLHEFFTFLAERGRIERVPNVGDFFAPNEENGRHVDLLDEWLDEQGPELVPLLERFNICRPEGVSEPPDESLSAFVNSLREWTEQVERWLDEYEEQIQEGVRSRQRLLVSRLMALEDRLRRESLIDFLCRYTVLPSYSFPIDVVSLRLPPTPEGSRLELERDLKIAIIEYAPGAEVVADKKIWKSVGVEIRKERLTYEYRVCRTCNHLDRRDAAGLPISGVCSVCGDVAPGKKHSYWRPDGFTTDLSKPPKQAGSQVEFAVNRSHVHLLSEGSRGEEQVFPDSERRVLTTIYRRDGELVKVNSGEDENGFWLCERCGAQVSPPRRNQRPQPHQTPTGGTCSGAMRQYHLGHSFHTDTLHLRFHNTPHLALPPGNDLSFWRSLTYALLQGSSLELQIERRDIDGVLHPIPLGGGDWSQEVVLFDNVPGGAGHVRRIAENISDVIGRALAVAKCDDCEESTSCYGCLRNYDNQFYHAELRRGPVAQFLERLRW